MPQQSNPKELARATWTRGSIYALIVVFILLIKATFSVLLLILAGVLIAVYFRGLSGLICRKTKWPQGLCLVISIVGSLLLLAGFFWLAGAKVQAQVQELSDQFPQMVSRAKAELSKSPLGQKIVEKASSPDTAKKAQDLAKTFFKSTFGVLGDVYVVLFLGLFFTSAPSTYKRGIVAVVPKKGKAEAENLLETLSDTLKKWLKGKIFSMAIVFALTAIGLVIMGVPMWLTLALLAGILNFIPNFGPIIALVPAVLVGLMQGTTTAFLIAGLYILVQVLESNVITPQIQSGW